MVFISLRFMILPDIGTAKIATTAVIVLVTRYALRVIPSSSEHYPPAIEYFSSSHIYLLIIMLSLLVFNVTVHYCHNRLDPSDLLFIRLKWVI